MSNVLIRDVPDADLDQLRAAAAAKGTSLQGLLRDAVRAQASHLRRQAALTRTAQRLRGRDAVPVAERDAVSRAIDAAHGERADRLGGAAR